MKVATDMSILVSVNHMLGLEEKKAFRDSEQEWL